MLAVCSCADSLLEPERDETPDGLPEGAKVTISFMVASEDLPSTKAQNLGEDPALTSLHLAVFGSSGYLKEYVEATPTGPCGETTFTDPATIDSEHPKITTVPLYGFTAKLTLTNSKRIVHFIGNGPGTLPFGYADAVLSSLQSESGKRAYWQMMEIDGIKAKQDDDGDYIDALGNKITDGQGYVAALETQKKFQEIPLVRNWAKIVVEADTNNGNNPNFTPISYAVVHVPDRGTVAPHSAVTGGFIKDYQKKTFSYLAEEIKYPANLPPNTKIDNSIPDINCFKCWDQSVEGHRNYSEVNGIGWIDGVAPADADKDHDGDGNPDGYGAVYLYERPVPTEQLLPTYVIIYGYFDDPDKNVPGHQDVSGKYFYKVDLMTDGNYYPIYRNFQYRILIHSILAPGHATPEAAVAAAGSADVSADINARHLPDISDGTRRLAIRPWMARTFTTEQSSNTELNVFFMSDVASEAPNMDPGAVTVEVLEMKHGLDEVIDPNPDYLFIEAPNDDPTDESYGWRTIHFRTYGSSSTIRSQTLRVTATSDGESLYRDIVITIQEKQPMQVICSESRIKAKKGTPVDVYIDIPDGLVESMFPLEFMIEAEALTLSPYNDNLPVQPGTSLSGSDKPSYHFIKTVSWDDYCALPTELDNTDRLWRRITCGFISNRANSSTRIFVSNPDFFIPANTKLGNFTDKTFWDLRFREPIQQNTPFQKLLFEFEAARDDDDELPTIEMTVSDLIPDNDREGYPLPEGFTQTSETTYRFKPTSNRVTIPVKTANNTGEVYLRLEAEDYQAQTLKTHHFTLFHGKGFIDGHATTNKLSGWSNVVYGKVNKANNKNVLFGYFDDPDDLNPTIQLISLDGLKKAYPTGFPWTPSGPKSTDGASNYHELEFTIDNPNNDLYRNLSFTLSAAGYLEVPVQPYRFSGNIFTSQYTSGNNMKAYTYNNTGDNTYFGDTTFSGGFYLKDKKNGLWLDPGESGTITFVPTDDKFKLFFIQLNIGKDNNKYAFPRMDPPLEEGSTFDKYPGSGDQCLWIRPELTGSASLTITAESDAPTYITGIIVKAVWLH